MNADETSPERTLLLDVAEKLIRDQGADGWSLTELAERAGLGLDEVDAQFDDPWKAFCHVIRRDEWRYETAALRPSRTSPSERLLTLLEACVPDPDWTFWIELWSLALRDRRAADLQIELDERFRNVIEEILRDGVEVGEFTVPDTRRTAITISALIDSMALQATLGDTTIRPNYMLDACVTVCGKLLGAPLKLPPLAGSDDD
jgi:AcrR family transcriptional regulator